MSKLEQLTERLNRPPKILVIDDDLTTCEVLSTVVADSGFEPVIAHNGLEAIALVEQNSDFVLILLDIKMPVMGGEEFLQELKNRKYDPPVIVVTGYPDMDLIARLSREYSILLFMAKPFDPEALKRFLSSRWLKCKT